MFWSQLLLKCITPFICYTYKLLYNSMKTEHSCRDKTDTGVWEIIGFRKQLSSVLLAPAGGDQSWPDRLKQHDNRTCWPWPNRGERGGSLHLHMQREPMTWQQQDLTQNRLSRRSNAFLMDLCIVTFWFKSHEAANLSQTQREILLYNPEVIQGRKPGLESVFLKNLMLNQNCSFFTSSFGDETMITNGLKVKVTSAPRAVRVSMSTAVCRVMWRQPAILAPFRGLDWPYSSLIFMRPGISFSAMSMAFRPHSARLMSAGTAIGTSETSFHWRLKLR